MSYPERANQAMWKYFTNSPLKNSFGLLGKEAEDYGKIELLQKEYSS